MRTVFGLGVKWWGVRTDGKGAPAVWRTSVGSTAFPVKGDPASPGLLVEVNWNNILKEVGINDFQMSIYSIEEAVDKNLKGHYFRHLSSFLKTLNSEGGRCVIHAMWSPHYMTDFTRFSSVNGNECPASTYLLIDCLERSPVGNMEVELMT